MKTFNAEQILNIGNPADLFDSGSIKSTYKTLVRLWHPDVNGGAAEAEEVFKHINKLYHIGLKQIEGGFFETASKDVEIFTDVNGKVFKVRYKAVYTFELGTMYIASTIVAYFIETKFEKFTKNALRKLESFKFANTKMEDQFKQYLPQLLKVVHTHEGTLVVFRKKKEELLLKDLLASLDSDLNPRHVAWIMSSLYNTACFLKYNNIVHNAISSETMFISPKGHYGVLLGGWWYATDEGKPLIGLPKRTIEKTKAIRDGAKIAKFTTDLELIRALGRDLLNDPAGNKLLRNKCIPKPLAIWLCCAASLDNAMKEYSSWNKVLDDSWGKRVYYNLDVTEQNVYNT